MSPVLEQRVVIEAATLGEGLLVTGGGNPSHFLDASPLRGCRFRARELEQRIATRLGNPASATD